MTAPDPTLRGKCHEMAEAAVADDPTLTVARGWYDDPVWGSQQHWWAKRPDGTIVDPTAAQFPQGGIAGLYREYDGTYPCEECGKSVLEADLVGDRCCSYECYGNMVGVSLS